MMLKRHLILLIEDEQAIRGVIRKYLERDQFQVIEAATGTQGLERARAEHPDLILVDVMLPELDGFDVVRALREDEPMTAARAKIPIIMLTARGDEIDRLYGFDLGVDDYVVKPFSPSEVVARVKAVLRRSGELFDEGAQTIQLGSLAVDPRSRSVQVDGELITLTTREFDLLWFLARHPEQVFSRAQLIEQIWGFDFPGDETTVTVHVQRLRDKLERGNDENRYIQTVRGVGYSLAV